MSVTTPETATASTADVRAAGRTSVLADYWSLTKPEITLLVALSAMAGFLLGSENGVNLFELAVTLVGVALASGGGAVLNHVIEREYDGLMKRTMQRPLPDGRVSVRGAQAFGVLLVMAGVGLLCPLTNPLTGVMAALTVALYLFVYTPLKRRTKHNTLIGTLPGALPALGGWTAATGSMDAGGWALFAILAVWQMPHFLSLAWMYRKDYERGGYAMLPVVEPDGRSTGRQTLGYTLLLIPVSVAPTLLGVASLFYAAAAVLLGVWFLASAWRFHRTLSPADARRVLMRSIVYIPALVAFIVADSVWHA